MAAIKKTIYQASRMAFSSTDAGSLIPNTQFTANKEDEHFYSIKNTTPSPSSGKIVSRLSSKIAKAVIDSQIVDENTIMAWGKKDKKEFLLCKFTGGTKNPIETFVVIPADKMIYATNIYSHLFYRLILGYDLLEFVKKGNKASDEAREVFSYLCEFKNLPKEKYDSITTGTLVESSEAEKFLPLCDSLYFTAKTFDGFNFKEIDNDELIDEEYAPYIQYNILPLVAMHNNVYDLSLDIGDEVVKEIHAPTIKRKSKKGKEAKAVTVFVPYSERDYSLMSDAEAKKLPLDLQRTRQIAMDLFEKNKESITDELWESIQSFKNGNIWKMGFYGPSASGKTTFVKMMAGALKLPFMILTGNSDTETSHLYGYMTIKDGTTEFCEGPLTRIMRYGGIFFFDERNMVNAGVVSATNNVLDDTRMYTIPQTGETIIAHDNFRYCEAMNIGYEGTKEDNLSHISRVDEWHNLSGYDEMTETNIIVNSTGIDRDLASKIIKCKNNIKTQIRDDGDETTQNIDLRNCLSWAKKIKDIDNPVRAAFTTVLAPLSKEVDRVKGSNKPEDFTATGDPVIDYAYNEIMNTFAGVKPKMPRKEYEFETIELV